MFQPKMTIDEELAKLTRGAEEIFPEGALEEKLKRAREEGRPLRVKLGIDPTATDLHLGHVIPILKLKTFQQLGHQVVLIIGDYTATVGDPSGRNKARPQLTHADVLENAKDYETQIFRILDRDRTEIVRNSDWFKKMEFTDVIELLSRMTVARMLEREDFQKRYVSHTPISLHELVYPLMQGYDSVMVKADIELGGTDQKFNIIVGRDLQRERDMALQAGLLNPVLIGTDGKEKMSKSLGNTIALNDPPEEMYGKVMSIPDELMWMYFELITDVPLEDVAGLKRQIDNTELNPRDIKKKLAREIVRRFYNDEGAQGAEAHFEQVIGRGDAPDHMPEFVVADEHLTDGSIWIVKLLVESGLASSNGEARRLVTQGGVKINGETVSDVNFEWSVSGEITLQAGRRRFVRVKKK